MSFDAPRKRKKSVNNDDLKDGGGDGGQDSGQPTQRGAGGATTQRPASTTKPITTEISKVDLTANVIAVGTWAYTIESPRGGAGNLKIKKEGEVYSGSIVNTAMNRENQLKTVTVKGNELSFSYEANFGGNVAEIIVKGIITGDQFTGTMQMGQFGSFPFVAKRAE